MTLLKISLVVGTIFAMFCMALGFTEVMGMIFNPIITFLTIKVPVWFILATLIATWICYGFYQKAKNRQRPTDNKFAESRTLLKHALAIQQNPDLFANIDELKKFVKYRNLKETDSFKEIAQSTVFAILKQFNYKTVFHINYAEGTIEWNPEEARILCGALQECAIIADSSTTSYVVWQKLRLFLYVVVKLDDKIFKKSGSKKALILYLQENLDIYRRKYNHCEFFFDIEFKKKEIVIK